LSLAILALALVWHWSAFLALWLSQNVGYISTFFQYFALGLANMGLAFLPI
jgi:hypothetical protein